MYVDKNHIQVASLQINIKQLIKNKISINYLTQIPYILFVILLTLLTTLPKATAHGLGGDGQFYAVLARNLSEGIGSFWIPSFSSTLLSNFYEHPPLGIGIQSIFFKIFGDSYLVEKLYSVATLFIIQFFMVLIWFRVFRSNERLKALFWLPLLFLILIPTVTHSVGNNVLENTMGVFTIIAMYSLLRSVEQQINYLWTIFAALMLVLAIITKGPVGAFLLVFYPLYFLTTKSINLKVTIQSSVALIFSFSLILGLLLLNDAARDSLTHYFNGQLMASIKNGRGMAANSHFYIVGELLKDLLPLFVILVLMYILKRKNIQLNYDKKVLKSALLFILIALSASIPSMISLKQNTTYIVTCYPYFAIGFAILATMMMATNQDNKNLAIPLTGKILTVFSLIGIFAVLIFSFATTGRILKQKNYYYDAKDISKYLTTQPVVGLCSKPEFPWDIHSFFARYYRVSLDYSDPYKYKYFIGSAACAPEPSKDYKLVNTEFRYLKFFERL